MTTIAFSAVIANSPPPYELDLRLEQGQSFSKQFVLREKATPANLLETTSPAVTGTCKIRRSYADDTALVSPTVTIGTTITATMSLTATQTAALPPGDWVYSLHLHATIGGVPSTIALARGRVRVLERANY